MFAMIRNIPSYLKGFVDTISFLASTLIGQSGSFSTSTTEPDSNNSPSTQTQSGTAPNASAYNNSTGYYNFSYDYSSANLNANPPGAQYTTSGSSGYAPSYNFQYTRPIDDLNKPIETKNDEDHLRCKLSSLCRVISNKGYNTSVYDSITVRRSQVQLVDTFKSHLNSKNLP